MALFLFSCNGIGEMGARIDLSGEWQIAGCGDIPPESAHTGPVSQRIRLPGSFHGYCSDNDDLTGFIVLRKEVFINREFCNDMLVLSLGKIAVADEVRFNGVLVGCSGYFPQKTNPLKYGFAWMKKRWYGIPANLVRCNDVNTINLRVFSHIISGIHGDLSLFSKRPLSQYTQWVEEIIDVANINAIWMILLLAVLFLFVLFQYKKYMEMVYSGFIIIFVFLIHMLLLGFIDIDGFLRFKLLYGLFPVVYFFIVMFAQGFFGHYNKTVTVISVILLVIVESLIVLAPNSRFLKETGRNFALIVVSIYVIFYLFLYILFRKKKRVRRHLFVFTAFALVVSTFFLYYHLIDFRFYTFPPIISFYIVPPIAGTLIIFITEYKSIRTENAELANRVLQKSRKLSRVAFQLNNRDRKPEPRDAIYDVIKYLEENYQETYDRKKLARRFNLNEDYLGQLFRKTTGCNISSFINRKRVEVAKDLLKDTDIQVIDIGYHVGFESLVHFHRIFKKLTGYTPKKYRRIQNRE